MNKFTALVLCLVLCLSGTIGSTAARVSAADSATNKVIIMTIGLKILTVDDVASRIDAGPQIKYGRTFFPIVPIINALGGTSHPMGSVLP